MSLPIDEIFGKKGVLQGEGANMGVPTVFLRTGGCNLRCPGFACETISPVDGTTLKGCDSGHAVFNKHFKHLWHYYDDYMELVRNIQAEFITVDAHDNVIPTSITITGGEPLLHHADPVLLNTLEYFISRGHKIVFETNGTIAVDFDKYPIYRSVSFSMSVKMSSSGEDKHKRWKPEVVNNYLKNTNDSYFKFVLSAKSIDEESTEVFEFLNQVPTYGNIWCMPLGETADEVQSNARAVYEFAAKNNFRYSDRLHIRIYDSLRGV